MLLASDKLDPNLAFDRCNSSASPALLARTFFIVIELGASDLSCFKVLMRRKAGDLIGEGEEARDDGGLESVHSDEVFRGGSLKLLSLMRSLAESGLRLRRIIDELKSLIPIRLSNLLTF